MNIFNFAVLLCQIVKLSLYSVYTVVLDDHMDIMWSIQLYFYISVYIILESDFLLFLSLVVRLGVLDGE